MPNPDRSRALDHVVVVMFENRPSTICSAEDGASRRARVLRGGAGHEYTGSGSARGVSACQRGA